MNVTLFIALLVVFSTITSLCTEASKKILNELNKFILNYLENDMTSRAIMLTGEWGSGKTSIVNMALEELDRLQESEENKIITLKFEPWHFTDSTQLFNQFLISLANEFGNYFYHKIYMI